MTWSAWSRPQSKTITYLLNSSYFSVGGHPSVRILGPSRTEDCNSWDGMITIILICAEDCNSSDRQASSCFNFSRPANLCFVCDACEEWWVCGQAWPCPLSNSIQYSRQRWDRMGRSIWPNIGHWAKKIATHFEVPGIYDSMFVFCWPRLRIRASDYADYYFD